MNDLTANISRAISDFDGIKAAIEDCGVPAAGAPVDFYSEKIEQIGQANENLHFSSMGRPYISHIVIPDGTAEIGDYAYDGCGGVTEIDIPESVASIGHSAFAGTAAEEIIIPNDDAKLSNRCFANCKQLISVRLPENLTTLAQGAFYGASSLPVLNLPDSIETLESSSTSAGMALKTVHLPAALKTILNGNFWPCGIEEAIFPVGLEKIGDNVLRSASNLKKVYLPVSVTSIGQNFMIYCSDLEEVLLGNGFQVSLDISMSTKYTTQMLADCIFNYADRSGENALTFTIGANNLLKLAGVYVVETAAGLEIVEPEAAGAKLLTEYAANKNLTLQ